MISMCKAPWEAGLTPLRPTADHYAWALLHASTLTGERTRLESLASYPEAVSVLRRTPLKARPLAYAALVARFGREHAKTIARVLNFATPTPKVLSTHRADALTIAGWL